MTLDEIKFFWQVGNTLITALIGVYLYLTNRHRVTNERISALENDMDGRLDTHSDRIAEIEGRIAAMPTHNDLAKLYDKLNRVAESSSRMEGELKGINDTLRLLLAQQVQHRGKP